MALPSYSTGTITVQQGGTSVIGTGTIWTGGNAREGDDFVVAGLLARIVEVVSVNELTITPWTGPDQSDAAYIIYQNAPRRFEDVQIADYVSRFVQTVNERGYVIPLLPSENEPDPSWGNDSQTAEKFSTGDKWQKVGGEWEYVGRFAPLAPVEEWSAEKQYHANSFVTRLGASYVGKRDSLNKPPESNPDDWAKLASEGQAATVEVGDVITGAPGSSASVSNSGNSHAAKFDFTIPTGKGYGGTSVTTLTIGNGTKELQTQAGLAYVIGDRVHLGATADPLNWMEGIVTSYSATGWMVVEVSDFVGAGSFSSWGIGLTGKPGTGDGDMKGAANLAELTNIAAARNNLNVLSADQSIKFYASVALEQAESRTTGPVFAGPGGNGLFDGFNTLAYVDIDSATGLLTSTYGKLRSGNGSYIDGYVKAMQYNSANFTNYNVRHLIPAEKLGSNADQIRLTLSGPSTGNPTVISDMFIGHRASSGDLWDFDGNQKRVTYAGNNGFTVPAGGSLNTDWITFNLDRTKDIIVAFHTASGDLRLDSVNDGPNIWFKVGASESGETNVSDYFPSSTYRECMVTTISCFQEKTLDVQSSLMSLWEVPDWYEIITFLNPGAGIVNSSIICEATRDGTTWVPAPLVWQYNLPDANAYVSGRVPFVGADGQIGKWRIRTTQIRQNVTINALGIIFGKS